MKCPSCGHVFREETTASHKQEAIEVISYLNKRAGRSYRPVIANTRLISGRLSEGATLEKIKQVIDKKCLDWSQDEKMKVYLRPATLFNREKFAQYEGELVVNPPKNIIRQRNACSVDGCNKVGTMQDYHRSGKPMPRFCREHYHSRDRQG